MQIKFFIEIKFFISLKNILSQLVNRTLRVINRLTAKRKQMFSLNLGISGKNKENTKKLLMVNKTREIKDFKSKIKIIFNFKYIAQYLIQN